MPTIAARTYNRLRELIVRCQLLPGAVVTASELAELLKVGRAPLRESLTRLTSEGLIRNIPRRGYEISPITLGDIRELFDARRVVDPQVGALAVKNASEDQLAKIVELAGQPATSPDYSGEYDDEFMEAGRDFHRAIADACGNPRLARFANQLNDDSQRIHYFQAITGHLAPSCIAFHHNELAEALQKRDSQDVHRLLVEQTDEEEEHLLKMFSESSLLESVNLASLVEV